MRHSKATLLSLVSFVLAVSVIGRSQQPAKNTSGSSSNPVHSIVLPDNAPDIPPGPDVEVYTNNCLLCHSARYVFMQPHFPKSVWAAEVKKMVANYGASISEHDQALIVDYLNAVRGVEVPPAAKTNAK